MVLQFQWSLMSSTKFTSDAPSRMRMLAMRATVFGPLRICCSHHPHQVRLHCGAKERVWKVEEPSRCEYTAQMDTPAACSEEAVAELARQLAAKEAAIKAAGDTPHDEL